MLFDASRSPVARGARRSDAPWWFNTRDQTSTRRLLEIPWLGRPRDGLDIRNNAINSTESDRGARGIVSGTRAATATHTDTMAAAVAPGSLEAKVASLEAQLASVRAQADADAINAEHLSQAMETRYAALAEEHSKVRSGIFRDVFVASARPIRCSRGASARSTFGSPRPRRRTSSSDSTKLQCRAFKNSPPHPPGPLPPGRVRARRDQGAALHRPGRARRRQVADSRARRVHRQAHRLRGQAQGARDLRGRSIPSSLTLRARFSSRPTRRARSRAAARDTSSFPPSAPPPSPLPRAEPP